MKLTWPFSNQKTTGKEVEVVKKSVSDTSVLGGFLDFFANRLTDEKKISDKLIKSFEGWVYINVTTLAEAVSLLEFELLQFRMVNGKVELEPIEEHELLDLLHKFNPTTTQSDAIYNTEAHLDLAGDSFWLLEGGQNQKKPTAIFLLRPDGITINPDLSNPAQALIKNYEYKILVDGKEQTKTYEPDEILQIKVPNPGNMFRGKSTVEAIAATLDADNYAEQALLNLFKNGLIGDFFLSAEKRMTPDQLKNFAAQFRAAFQGVRNAWKVPILFGGIKAEKLMMSGREMQLIELEGWFRNKIMSAFKNTRSSLGIDDEVNRSTSESSLLNWKRSVIAPKMARIVNNLNEFLVPRYGENLILGFKDPVPEDRASEIKEATDLFNAKIITKNEARQILDYEEVEGGDDFETTVDPLKPLEPQVPKSLKYVNYKSIFRKASVFSQAKDYQEAYKKARPIAEKIIKGRKKDAEEVREHEIFTNEQVWGFHNDKIQMVGNTETVFKSVLENYIDELLSEMVNNLPKEINKKFKVKQLIDDEEAKIAQAVSALSPTLVSISVSSGGQALKLIGSDNIYIANSDLYAEIRRQIEKFAKSMIETDKDSMAEIIARGIDEGHSIPKIERSMREAIPELKKVQSTRITRTEVLKASNHASVKAWEESGLVMAKQWLTARDDRVDPLCASLNGKIVNLDTKFFKKGETYEAGGETIKLSYASVPEPPLHVNCRCDVLPVLIGQKNFDVQSYEKFQELNSEIDLLKEKADKRTKEFKELEAKYEASQKSEAETKEFAKELEKIVGLGDEK